MPAAQRAQFRGRATILETSLQAALTAHLAAVFLPVPKAVSPWGSEVCSTGRLRLHRRNSLPGLQRHQHINLSSPASQTPCSFNLNVHVLTPKSKKALMPESQAISHLMVNAVSSKMHPFPQASYPATSSAGTTCPSFPPRKGSDLKALLPQPPKLSPGIPYPCSGCPAPASSLVLVTLQRYSPDTPLEPESIHMLCHCLAHQYLLELATHFQASFHIHYYSLISLTAAKHFDRSHFTPCLHSSSPLVLLR